MEPSNARRTKAFALGRTLDYLPAEDRYLSAAPTPNYKFNIIGAGIIGQEHIRVTQMEGRASIHGVYDPTPSSRISAQNAYAQYNPHTPLVEYDSLKAAVNDPKVDGLIICTPNFTHLEILKTAIASGKHILLEKPMATTLPDAYDIYRMAEDYNAVLQIGLQYRYKAIYVEAIHEALERQAIGQIKTMTILEHRPPFLDKVHQWNKFSRYSGGTLVEKCCHYFDLFNLFAQSRPSSVYASGNMAVNFKDFNYHGETADVIDNAFVIINYDNNIRANFNLCMFSPTFHEELILCGDEGRLKTFEQETFLPDAAPETHLEIMRGDQAPSRITTPCYPTTIAKSGHSGATFYEHASFIDNIEGKPNKAASTLEGLWSVILGVAAETAIRQGGPVDIESFLNKNKISL